MLRNHISITRDCAVAASTQSDKEEIVGTSQHREFAVVDIHELHQSGHVRIAVLNTNNVLAAAGNSLGQFRCDVIHSQLGNAIQIDGEIIGNALGYPNKIFLKLFLIQLEVIGGNDTNTIRANLFRVLSKLCLLYTSYIRFSRMVVP